MHYETRGSSKLTAGMRKKLILNLCRSICVLDSPGEVADALADLLTPKEMETIAKRLQIAEYLIVGDNYKTIREELKVGYATIARVNTWLNLSGEGYRIMLTKKKKSPQSKSEQEMYDPYSWHNIKRRYSMHFWPQLVLEELARTSDKKERKKIERIYQKLDLKRARFRGDANRMFYEMFSSKLDLPKKKFSSSTKSKH